MRITLSDLIQRSMVFPVPMDALEIQFFVLPSDDPKRLINLEVVQVLDSGDGKMIIQLKDKPDATG